MIISYCIPYRDRSDDLNQALPTVIRAAELSPPVEIVILDYGSQKELNLGIDYSEESPKFSLKIIKCPAPYYHMAHARNLSMLAGGGEYLVATCADVLLHVNFFRYIRDRIEQNNLVFMYGDIKYPGIVVCRKDEFVDSGGYDERFEFYGPEDKDLQARLKRRGGSSELIPDHLIGLIPTPDKKKVENYRLNISKHSMHKMMMPFYEENIRNNAIITNIGIEWGKHDLYIDSNN